MNWPQYTSGLVDRLGNYPWWQVAIELSVIWVVVYLVIRFVQGTRAAGALKGTLVLLVAATILFRVLGEHESFQRIKFLYQNFLTLLAVTLIVVFQPELRRALIRLGEAPLLRRVTPGGSMLVADAIAEACAYLSKAKFGALIVVQRETPLRAIAETGTQLHARVSARLLKTIFFPGSALHDLAVVVVGGEIHAAGVQLPLAEPEEMPDRTLGSRHRAAVGLSRECDAVVVVVSEETGRISLAERGRLEMALTPDQLRDELLVRLGGAAAGGELAAASVWRGRRRTDRHPSVAPRHSAQPPHSHASQPLASTGTSGGSGASPVVVSRAAAVNRVETGGGESGGVTGPNGTGEHASLVDDEAGPPAISRSARDTAA